MKRTKALCHDITMVNKLGSQINPHQHKVANVIVKLNVTSPPVWLTLPFF